MPATNALRDVLKTPLFPLLRMTDGGGAPDDAGPSRRIADAVGALANHRVGPAAPREKAL